jgi:AcrR family transcriptional regulator
MRRRSPDDIRAEVRDAALTQFLEAGYEASSLDDVARRVGMTRQGVLYHYATKEKLLHSIVDPAVAALECALDSLPQEPARCTAERRHILGALIEPLCEHRDTIAFILRFTNKNETMNIGALTRSMNTRVAQLLAGDAFERDVATRIRVVSCLAALSGVMGARLAVPLETQAEREILVDCLLAILEEGGSSQRGQSEPAERSRSLPRPRLESAAESST